MIRNIFYTFVSEVELRRRRRKMERVKIFFWVMVSLLWLGNGIVFGQEEKFPLIHIRETEKAPVIDGKITKEEWADATEIMNFRRQGTYTAYVSRYRTRFYITFDEKNLYVGWECFIPRLQFIAHKIGRDGPVWNNDSIELFFDPDNARTDNIYYQLIINSIGSIYDTKGRDTVSWNPSVNHKEEQGTDRWSGEIAIPFNSFGLKVAPSDGTIWGANFCRNQTTSFSDNFPNELSMWSFTGKNQYAWPSGFGYVIFDRKAPVVKVSSLGEFVSSYKNECRISIKTYEGMLMKITGLLDLVPEGGEKITSVQEILAQREQNLSFFYQADDYDKKHTLSIKISDTGTGKVYYSTGMLPFKPIFLLNVHVKPFYYQNILRIEVDTTMFPDSHESVDISIVRNQKVIERKQEKIFKEEKAISFNMDKLSEDTSYQIMIKVLDKNKKEVGSRIVNYHYPKKPEWWNSKAGISDDVLPPWTPLEVKENSVKCWGREYVFSHGMWPSQIVTRGAEILSSPIQLEAKIDNQFVTFSKGKIKIKSQKPNKVIFTYEDNSSILKLNAEISIEYDGMIRTDFKLTPSRPVQIESLILNIPLKSSHGKLYLYRSNISIDPYKSAGAIGADGWKKEIIWQPYVWVGNEDGGISWFAESDEGWLPYDRKDTTTITNKGEQVILSMNILKEANLLKPLSLTMGLEATPIKPFPADYRTGRLVRRGDHPGGPIGPTKEFGGFTHWLEKHIEYLEKLHKGGAKAIRFHSFWSMGFGRTEPYDPEKFRVIMSEAHKRDILVYLYFTSTMFTPSFPEYEMNQYDWEGNVPFVDAADEVTGYGGRKDQTIMSICPASPSYADYLAHGIKKLIEDYDIDGVYYDGHNTRVCSGMHGYWTEDGKRRVTYPLFQVRELGKRIYTLFKTMKKESIIENHYSYGLIIPIDAFVDCHMDGEQFSEATDYALALDLFRAEFMGRQFGIPIRMLSIGSGTSSIRSAYGLALIHEGVSLYDFNPIDPSIWKIFDDFDINNVEFFPYWNNSSFVKTSEPGTYVSFYKSKKGKGLLFIVTNWTNKDVKTEVEINFPGLGFSPSEVLITGVELPASDKKTEKSRENDNIYDKEPLNLSGSKISLTIGEYNFRMIRVTKKGDK